MEPEEMDVVELLADVPVDPSWHIQQKDSLGTLARGQRGMVVHRRDETPPTFVVEFVDPASLEPIVLATLPGAQLRVERDTLAIE